MKSDKYREAGDGAINVNVNANDYGLTVLPKEAPSEADWEAQFLRLTDMQNKVAGS